MSKQVRCTLSDIRVLRTVQLALAQWSATGSRRLLEGADREEGEEEEATLPAGETAQVKEAAVSAQSSVASRHVESVQPIMYYA